MAETSLAERSVEEVAVERLPKRRHEEILAPRPARLTAAVTRRAWRAIGLLAILAALIQPASIPFGHYMYARLDNGTDIYSQWRGYAARPAPDVLFLGPSESRTDVDTKRLSDLLSTSSGRQVSVAAIGVGAAQPALLDVLMYRVMSRPARPRLVVITLEAPMFNGNAVCRACGRDPLSSDLWQLSDTLDPGFYSLALQNDPNRAGLALGWVLPSLAYYPSVAAFDCAIVNRERRAFQLVGPTPWELRLATPCEVGEAAHPGHEMTEAQAQGLVQVYQADFVGRYKVSPQLVADERDLVGRARAGGAQVLFLEPPFHSSIRASDQPVRNQFDGAVRAVANELHVQVLDLSASVPDDASMWYDPLHLNAAGARYAASPLAQALAPAVAGPVGQLADSSRWLGVSAALTT